VNDSHRRSAAFLLPLGVLEYIVFSASFSQFFQGDALFHMSHRFRSWPEFFTSLYRLDVANWYRPLSNRTIPSLFFNWFGLNPYGYHWVEFLLFFVTTCILFFFLRELTKSFVAAAAGTVFFGIHSIDVYVTYDFAFAPELFYGSFYLLSAIAWMKGASSKAWYSLSILFFVLALMSKEAAVTLPANLLLLTSFFSANREKKYLLPYFGILTAYYFYIVRFLHVGTGDYALSLHKDLFLRIEDSFLWAFNLGREQMRYPVALTALLVIAIAVMRRRHLLFGLCWFLVALAPMLAIVGHFGPYYLFVALAGIALIVGDGFDWLYLKVAVINRTVAFAVVCLMMAPFAIAARFNAQAALYIDTALGYAGRIAGNSARDMKQLHPSIPRGAIVYIVNPDQPELWRYYGINALFRLLYEDDTIDVRYSSQGHSISEDDLRSGKVIAMRYATESLVPEDAQQVLASLRPNEDFHYESSNRFGFETFPARVVAGKGAYTMHISGAADTDVEVQYRFNEGPIAFMTVHVDRKGETRFFVSTETKRGVYRFVGMRMPPDETWFAVAGSVTVTD